MTEVECIICIENYSKNDIFKCLACKFENCISCHKKYLLSNTQYPHCMNPECRSAIPYDIFLQKFNRKWVFNEYKLHRSTILLNREKSLLPEMVQQISIEKDIEEKRKVLYKQITDLRRQIHEIEDKISDLSTDKKNRTKYNFTYACPKQDCKGFLNENYNCALCNSDVCKQCYVVKENNKKEPHVCNPDMVETFTAIKKEAKPCPTCGEFISKINGCSQMFCVKCGTAFDWKTGLVEKGIIHNPHAHQFFHNNPEARDAYLNNRNNHNNGDNVCRTPIPNIVQLQILSSLQEFEYLRGVHRNISEFRQYKREGILRVLNQNINAEENLDIRKKYLNNEYNDKMFKSILHKREKNNFYLKQMYPLALFSFEIAEVLLWEIVDNAEKNKIINPLSSNRILGINSKGYEIIKKNVELLKSNANDTQNNMNNLKDDFGYTAKPMFSQNYYFHSSY
jgi:hypothetical protein